MSRSRSSRFRSARRRMVIRARRACRRLMPLGSPRLSSDSSTPAGKMEMPVVTCPSCVSIQAEPTELDPISRPRMYLLKFLSLCLDAFSVCRYLPGSVIDPAPLSFMQQDEIRRHRRKTTAAAHRPVACGFFMRRTRTVRLRAAPAAEPSRRHHRSCYRHMPVVSRGCRASPVSLTDVCQSPPPAHFSSPHLTRSSAGQAAEEGGEGGGQGEEKDERDAGGGEQHETQHQRPMCGKGRQKRCARGGKIQQGRARRPPVGHSALIRPVLTCDFTGATRRRAVGDGPRAESCRSRLTPRSTIQGFS